MKSRISGEALLLKYGITSPEEIDLEAIAYCEGAKVQYKPIKGSEARLIGMGDRAIITINSGVIATRQRFSLAHELGHWVSDRGTIGKLCKREDIGANKVSKKIDWSEVAANRFASDVLMPMTMFIKASRGLKMDFNTVTKLEQIFRTSKLATALRLIDADHYPCALAYSKNQKINWMYKSKSVPKEFWYNSNVGTGSVVCTLVQGSHSSGTPEEVSAAEWFSITGSDNYSIQEHSEHYWNGILSLLWWKNESQILEWSGR